MYFPCVVSPISMLINGKLDGDHDNLKTKWRPVAVTLETCAEKVQAPYRTSSAEESEI